MQYGATFLHRMKSILIQLAENYADKGDYRRVKVALDFELPT